MQIKSKLNPIINTIKKFLTTLLFLSLLVTPVFGYNDDIDDPKDYSLTEYPEGYVCDKNEYDGYYSSVGTPNNRYVQYFYPVTNEGNYISNREIYVFIYTVDSYNDKISMYAFEHLKDFDSKHDNGYAEINELYGFGDKSYKIINSYSDNFGNKHLIFIKNHVIIDIRGEYESIYFSELIKFADLYENKINSVLDNEPQIFVDIDLERGGLIYYAGDDLDYRITLSHDASVVIENQVNDDEWTFLDERKFYKKGQYKLSAIIDYNKFGDEKLKLTATSPKGSTATSIVSFTSKERITSTPVEIPTEELPMLDPPTETSTSIPQTPGFSIMYVLFMGFLAYYKKNW
jgi:hypothetical protein